MDGSTCPGCGVRLFNGGLYCSVGCQDNHELNKRRLDRDDDEKSEIRKEYKRRVAARKWGIVVSFASILLTVFMLLAHVLSMGLKIIWAIYYYPLRAVYRKHLARTKQPAIGNGSKGAEYALLGAGYVFLAMIAVAIVMIAVIGVQVWQHRQAVQKELAVCSSLWEDGKRAEAVEKYKGLIEKDLASMPKSDRSVVVSRVIDHEAEINNTDSAKTYIELARKQGIPLSLNRPEGQGLFAQIQTEREAAEREKWEAAERQKQEAAEKAERERQDRLAAAKQREQEAAEKAGRDKIKAEDSTNSSAAYQTGYKEGLPKGSEYGQAAYSQGRKVSKEELGSYFTSVDMFANRPYPKGSLDDKDWWKGYAEGFRKGLGKNLSDD